MISIFKENNRFLSYLSSSSSVLMGEKFSCYLFSSQYLKGSSKSSNSIFFLKILPTASSIKDTET